MFPDANIEQYNLLPLVHNGFVFVEILLGMYGLPQACRLANDQLIKFLAPRRGYHPSALMPEVVDAHIPRHPLQPCHQRPVWSLLAAHHRPTPTTSLPLLSKIVRSVLTGMPPDTAFKPLLNGGITQNAPVVTSQCPVTFRRPPTLPTPCTCQGRAFSTSLATSH
ncbi:hypothetical protein MHU86_25812 [Fragilaria crotonensis]|nr:hypothetical protein MHU86_25812 [Fragilaria crotonensis]